MMIHNFEIIDDGWSHYFAIVYTSLSPSEANASLSQNPLTIKASTSSYQCHEPALSLQACFSLNDSQTAI